MRSDKPPIVLQSPSVSKQLAVNQPRVTSNEPDQTIQRKKLSHSPFLILLFGGRHFLFATAPRDPPASESLLSSLPNADQNYHRHCLPPQKVPTCPPATDRHRTEPPTSRRPSPFSPISTQFERASSCWDASHQPLSPPSDRWFAYLQLEQGSSEEHEGEVPHRKCSNSFSLIDERQN